MTQYTSERFICSKTGNLTLQTKPYTTGVLLSPEYMCSLPQSSFLHLLHKVHHPTSLFDNVTGSNLIKANGRQVSRIKTETIKHYMFYSKYFNKYNILPIVTNMINQINMTNGNI